jgi:hypothetical protein
VFPSLPALSAFPYILGISVLGCIVGSYLTKPEPDEVLTKFYMQVRPWGLWKPVLEKVKKLDPAFEPNCNFKRDAFNVAVGILWQSSLVALPIFIVIQKYSMVFVTLGAVILTSVILKLNWWNKLDVASAEALPLGEKALIVNKG